MPHLALITCLQPQTLCRYITAFKLEEFCKLMRVKKKIRTAGRNNYNKKAVLINMNETKPLETAAF